MLYLIVWGIIAVFIVKAIAKSSKPDYVVEWDKKVKQNEKGIIKIQSIAMPDSWDQTEEEWLDYISKARNKLYFNGKTSNDRRNK